jgi:hypothetical protein
MSGIRHLADGGRLEDSLEHEVLGTLRETRGDDLEDRERIRETRRQHVRSGKPPSTAKFRSIAK